MYVYETLVGWLAWLLGFIDLREVLDYQVVVSSGE